MNVSEKVDNPASMVTSPALNGLERETTQEYLNDQNFQWLLDYQPVIAELTKLKDSLVARAFQLMSAHDERKYHNRWHVAVAIRIADDVVKELRGQLPILQLHPELIESLRTLVWIALAFHDVLLVDARLVDTSTLSAESQSADLMDTRVFSELIPAIFSGAISEDQVRFVIKKMVNAVRSTAVDKNQVKEFRLKQGKVGDVDFDDVLARIVCAGDLGYFASLESDANHFEEFLLFQIGYLLETKAIPSDESDVSIQDLIQIFKTQLRFLENYEFPHLLPSINHRLDDQKRFNIETMKTWMANLLGRDEEEKARTYTKIKEMITYVRGMEPHHIDTFARIMLKQ